MDEKDESSDGANSEDIDLDYSQTHLEDFLKSQTTSSMMKGSNIQSGQLLNSFLSTYNKMKSGTGATQLSGTGENQKQSKLGGRKTSSQAMNAIQERPNDSESQTTEKKEQEDSEDEDFGRGNEVIELEKVSVTSSVKSQVKQKAIITEEEAKQIQSKME